MSELESGAFEAEIAGWDGRSTAVIQAVFDRNRHHDFFLDAVLELSARPRVQVGATWLLKRFLETGGADADAAIGSRVAATLWSQLDNLEHWAATLHVLQCMPFLPISSEDVQPVESFLRACVEGDVKFVRAWAYSGFYELAVRHPAYQDDVQRLLEGALETEAASVRARIRNVMQRGF